MFGDLAKSFGRSFLLGNLVPVVLFVSANILLVAFGILTMPQWWIGWQDLGIKYLDHKIAILFLLAVFIALGLQQFRVPLIQLYEGYFGREWFPLLKRRVSAYERMYIQRIKEIEERRKKGEDTTLMEFTLSREFAHRGNILPTKLGNIIRAFEYYAHRTYNIDPITGWSRLTAVIPSSYKEEIEKAEVDFNFALNLSFLVAVLGIECFVMAILPGRPLRIWSFIVSVGCFALSYSLYCSSCSYAQWWGEYARSAFDLYRFDLLKQIGVSVPSQGMTLREEKGIWARLQEQTFYGADPGDPLFLPELKELRFLPRPSQLKPGDDG